MPEPKVKVKARVRCVVDIPVDTWSEDSSFKSLNGQIRREGSDKVRKILEGAGGSLFGDPKVIIIIAEEE